MAISPSHLPEPALTSPTRWAEDARASKKGRLVVDDDLVECPDADYMTIQEAVNEAATAKGTDRIEVCAGAYPEDVTIGPDNSLMLIGAGMDQTFVTGAGSGGTVIDVMDAGRVEIQGLAVDGGATYARGIRYTSTSGKVEQIAVGNVRSGIEFRNGGGQVNVAATDNYVHDFTRSGILADGEGVDLKAMDNRVVGPASSSEAANGIQVSRGAKGLVMKNDIRDAIFSGNPASGVGSGVILFCAAPGTKVQHNTVSGADIGIAIADNQGADVMNNAISGSNFDGISLQFIGLFFGDIGCGVTPTEHNRVQGNAIDGSSFDGISLANFDAANAPATPNDNEVKLNTISNSGGNGIGVFDGQENAFASNAISDSGVDGIYVDGDATNNRFTNNDVSGSGVLSCNDMEGAVTNTWLRNEGQQPSNPPDICPN